MSRISIEDTLKELEDQVRAIRKTAEDWETFFFPHLIIHQRHGFGSGYMEGPDKSFYNEPITLKEFEQKLVSCSIMQCPADLKVLAEQLHENLKTSDSRELSDE